MHGDADKLFGTEYTVCLYTLITCIVIITVKISGPSILTDLSNACCLQSISKSPLSPYNQACLPYNKFKNRFGNVFPCKNYMHVLCTYITDHNLKVARRLRNNAHYVCNIRPMHLNGALIILLRWAQCRDNMVYI